MARRKLVLLLPLLGCTGVGAGCAATSEIVATEVLNYARCQELKRGINQISFGELSVVRGVRMLRDPSQPEQTVVESLPPNAVLVAVFNGRQPTPGYGFVFTNANQTGKEVRLNYTWQTPAPDSVQASVVTSPCSVMQLQPMQQGMTVSAWLDDAPMGTITVRIAEDSP